MRLVALLLSVFLTSSVYSKSLKLMQFNTENLFDTQHDVGTTDYTYLPMATKNNLPNFHEVCQKMGTEFYIRQCLTLDWSEALLTKKIIGLARVIKAYDASGMGPDIIIFQEIENKNALSKLVSKGLKELGYQHIALIEGDDSRGIDVGLISKYPISSSKHHSLFHNGEKLDTRGILEVTVDVDGNDVVLFGNHWPSQGNPTAERISSAKLLEKLASEKRADLIVAMGDFNTLESESPRPFDQMKGFIDAEAEARKVQTNLNPGTHFFKGKWSSLDRIFIYKSSALKPNYKTFKIFNHSFLLRRDSRTGQMIPNRFNAETGEGFSDHLSLGLEITL